MAIHNALGKAGEDAVAAYLEHNGYVIRDRNWRKNRLELDIVATKDNGLIIVEVKTRSNTEYIKPQDAVKQQRILEAEGEAQAILAVQKANADAIRLLNEAMPTDKVLAIRSLEALAKVANGKATKIIIPSELQNLGGVVPSIKELMTDPKDAE